VLGRRIHPRPDEAGRGVQRCLRRVQCLHEENRRPRRPALARPGYDMVRRPPIRHDETMSISRNMNMVCPPTYAERTYSWCVIS
jgi:hypothetical protein